MTKKETNEGKYPDEETREILEEMEEDGIKDDIDDSDPDEKPNSQQEEQDLDEEVERRKKKDEDEDEEDLDDDDEEDDDEEEKDKEDDEDEDEEKEELKSRKRPVKNIPVWQHKMEVKRAKQEADKQAREEMESELKKRVEDTPKGLSEKSDEIQSIVKEFGLDEEQGPKFVKSLIDVVEKKMGASEFSKKVEKLESELADAKEEAEFNKEFDTVSSVLRDEFGELSNKDLSRIKKKLKDLAYSEKYHTYPLEDIVKLKSGELKPSGKKKTLEKKRTRQGNRNVKSYDLDDPDSIPWDDLSDEEFDKLSKLLEERTPRVKIYRKGQKIN